jgi:hypothetical protein
MSTDNVNTEVTVPETPAPEAVQAPEAEGAPGGAQPAPEQSQPAPAQDNKPGSEPTVPYSRFAEVLAERNRLRQAQQPAPQPAQPPAGPPKPEDFNGDFDAYNAAVIDFRVQQGIQNYSKAQQQAQIEQFHQNRALKADVNFSQKLTEAVAKDPNVLAILQSAPPLRNDLQVNLKEHKDPIGLGKHLAQNPNLVYEMNNLPPDLAVQRMWEIGQSLAGSTTQPKQSASKAPPPISPVGSGKTNTTGTYRNDMTQEEFNASFKPIW